MATANSLDWGRPNIPSLPIPWQSDADGPLRQRVTEQIVAIFTARRGASGNGSRIQDFVRRLEDALYRGASSQAEYADPVTLESRLQAVARRYVKGGAAGSGAPANGNMALPGMAMQQQGQGMAHEQQQQQQLHQHQHQQPQQQLLNGGLYPDSQLAGGPEQLQHHQQQHQQQRMQGGHINGLLASPHVPSERSGQVLPNGISSPLLAMDGGMGAGGAYRGSQQFQQQQQQQQQHAGLQSMQNGASHTMRGASLMQNGAPVLLKGGRDAQNSLASNFVNGSHIVPTAMHNLSGNAGPMPGHLGGGGAMPQQAGPGFVPTSSTGGLSQQSQGLGQNASGLGSGMVPVGSGLGQGMLPMHGPSGGGMVPVGGPGPGPGPGPGVGPGLGSMHNLQGGGMSSISSMNPATPNQGHDAGPMGLFNAWGGSSMGGGMSGGMSNMQGSMQGSLQGPLGSMQGQLGHMQGHGQVVGGGSLQGPGSGMMSLQGNHMLSLPGHGSGAGLSQHRQSPIVSAGNGMGLPNGMQQQQQQQQQPLGGFLGNSMHQSPQPMAGNMMGMGSGMQGGGMPGSGLQGSGMHGVGMQGGMQGMGMQGGGLHGGMQGAGLPPQLHQQQQSGMANSYGAPQGSGMLDNQLSYPGMPGHVNHLSQQQQPRGPGQGQEVSSSNSSQVTKQQRWLLFLRHCAKCRQSDQECSLQQQCRFGKVLWSHLLHCSAPNCAFPKCGASKELLKHHQRCQDPKCQVCGPVKEYVKRIRHQDQPMGPQPAHMPTPAAAPGAMLSNDMQARPQQQQQQQQQQQPPLQQQQYFQPPPQQQQQPLQQHLPLPGVGVKRERGYEGAAGAPGGFAGQGPAPGPVPVLGGGALPHMRAAADSEIASKRPRGDEPMYSKNIGTSLLEAFSWEQIQVHVDALRAGAAAQKSPQVASDNPDDACQACGLTKLLFEPAVVWCNGCNTRIKQSQVYFSTPFQEGNSDIKGAWCQTCYNSQKPERILLEGSTFKKADLIKTKNEADCEEGWVQCDSCQCWVHQICGLFNKGRNNQETHYLCPGCLQNGLKTGMRQRIEVRPQSMLDARELPHTQLSQYIEQHMASAIEEERTSRAKAQGLLPYQVPGAEGLSVRVVNSLVKKCETRSRFADAFSRGDGYPTEFPYRQRVIVLFQNLDGVDVCLFIMYVQEYGATCPAPNTNCVYLSYLDSVKYFRPESVMAFGCPNPNTSLRTFVYHQLQVAYLSYVKKLGFETMYIWACPPMQGDDYILYCHPSKQKTPRSDRLRAWYIDMLKDARNRGIVKQLSTLWDTYFDGGKDHKMEKCSALQIPYLEGDYWPGEAENLLGFITENTTKAAGKKESSAGGGRKGKRYGGGPATTDEQLMARLGEILGGNMKEDFIVVHLQEVCSFCRRHVDSGYVYRHQGAATIKKEGVKVEGGSSASAASPSSLTLCEACFVDEQKRFSGRGGPPIRLPMGVSPDRLEVVAVEPGQRVQESSVDIECEHFETRQSFLNLCQGNHYQFDTIRRAKHSSMMVLYYLHNPEAPAFTTTCNVCNCEIESGTGFRCTVCPDFDMCVSCHHNTTHPHPLTKHAQRVDETRTRLTEQERRERNEQLQRTMLLLVHACSCNNTACASASCKKVKMLFRHSVECPTKVTGGCQMCKKMWSLLNLHAKGCTAHSCPVPRCRELKELRRRQAARQEDARRVAYQKMLQVQSQGAGAKQQQ